MDKWVKHLIVFLCLSEEVSMLERSKYKFSPLTLPEELPAFFHGMPHAPTFLAIQKNTSVYTHTHVPCNQDDTSHKSLAHLSFIRMGWHFGIYFGEYECE